MIKINIPESILHQIIAVLANFPEVEKAYLYGSRARGDHKPTSDIDLAVLSDGSNEFLRRDILARLEEDVITALKFDVVVLSDLTNSSLIESINRDKVQIYGTRLTSSPRL